MLNRRVPARPNRAWQIIFGVLGCSAIAAQAQTQTTPTTTEQVESIVVTGSRLQKLDVIANSPVTTVGKTELELARTISIERTLTQLPQFQGSFGGNTTGNDNRGGAVLDLRGLGQNRSLTLIDGKRAAPFGFRNSADLNTIPTPLVRRVEVLTGGAAAVYGADAVAGVVNFILNDQFRGLEVSGTANISGEGDAFERGTSLTGGGAFGARGSVTAFLGYSARDGLINADRDLSNPERLDAGPRTARAVGGVITRSDNASVFNLTSIGGAATSPRVSFTDAGGVTGDNVTSIVSGRRGLLAPNERLYGGVFLTSDLNDKIEAYGRITAALTKAEERLVPANGATSVLIQKNNPFLTPTLRSAFAGAYNLTSAGAAGGTDAFRATVTRSYPEFGDTVLDTDRTNTQILAGLRGELGKSARWDVFTQFGTNEEQTTITGDGIVSRLQQAANATLDASGKPVCVDPSGGCVPVNLFGAGNVSSEALAFITQPFQQERTRTQTVTGASISGDTKGMLALPGGPLDWVLGAEYRRERGTVTFEPALQTGLTLNQGARLNFGGVFDTRELFGEVRLPMAKDLPLIKALNVEGAYRYTRDSGAGTGNAWKIGGDWNVEGNVRMRGSLQSVVRAPNVGERFGVLSSVALLGRAVDPCANTATSGANADLCRQTGAPASPYTAVIPNSGFFFGGNPAIKSEKGRTFTVGAVFAPVGSDFSLTADYFNIEIDNAITAFGAQAVLNNCYLLGVQLFCGKIKRGADGQLVSIDSTDSNIAVYGVKGFDIGASYRMRNVVPGSLTLSYNANVVQDLRIQVGPGAPVFQCEGKFGPTCGLETSRAQHKYSHRFAALWALNNWTAQLAWRHISAVTDDATTVYTVERIKAQDTFDVAGSWKFMRNWKLVFGIDNVADKKAPQVFSQQTFGNTLPISYDVVGRRFGASVTYTMN
jgi:iron complex outermembrane recepter protein